MTRRPSHTRAEKNDARERSVSRGVAVEACFARPPGPSYQPSPDEATRRAATFVSLTIASPPFANADIIAGCGGPRPGIGSYVRRDQESIADAAEPESPAERIREDPARESGVDPAGLVQELQLVRGKLPVEAREIVLELGELSRPEDRDHRHRAGAEP